MNVMLLLLGALVLGIADDVAQRLGELPVRMITVLIGGPFFCRVLMTQKG